MKKAKFFNLAFLFSSNSLEITKLDSLPYQEDKSDSSVV